VRETKIEKSINAEGRRITNKKRKKKKALMPLFPCNNGNGTQCNEEDWKTP